MTQKSTFEQYVENPERRRILEQERVIVDATELISRAMKFRSVKRSELAEKLGHSKAYITQILQGNQNLTLRTLTDVFYALNCHLVMVAATETAVILVRQWNMTQQTGNAIVTTEYEPLDEYEGAAA